MKVIKIGGGCLNGKETIDTIVNLIAERGEGHVFVVSALYGITDKLIQAMTDAMESEDAIAKFMDRLREEHGEAARFLIERDDDLQAFMNRFEEMLSRLERFYYGLNFTGEMTLKMRDMISSFGERFSAVLLAHAIRSRGKAAESLMPHEIGVITDGKFGDATALPEQTSANLKDRLLPLSQAGQIMFVPGFFGISEKGEITTFGRGGSDYSAAVVAAAVEAEVLEIWKDVDGFMSSDPRFVKDARFIPELSYEEAAELAYFGATILHPRTVEPVRKCNIDIVIKNTLDPDAKGTVITDRSRKEEGIVKSITYTKDVGILKVHASGVGARPGILGIVANQVSDSGINIKSVVTSQTCISLLLSQADLDGGYESLARLTPSPYRSLEKIDDIVLLSIVGEGLANTRGVAAKCFSAISEAGGNIDMISFGPSKVALYFIMESADLELGVHAIHKTFF